MTANHPKSAKNWTYVFLPVLILLLFTVIFTAKSLKEPSSKAVLASENKNVDANQPSADANTQPKQKAPEEEKETPRPKHTHPAFSQHSKERTEMVATQIRAHGVRDPNVLNSLRTVPRHVFVLPSDLRRAYSDQPLPIGLGQTISQPYIVGYMTEALKLDTESKVLEIGTGSGYQAAVCAEIAQEVYTIEILEELAKSAQERLKELGYRNVSVKAADGYFGWKEKSPFDAIIVTCTAGFVPPPLIEQLKPNGRMILPLGSPFGAQTLVLITKDDKGKVQSKQLLPVRFVPMLGRASKGE
jgi:protein-L-isoaspartate(D-aspartate) O-methyltransferase